METTRSARSADSPLMGFPFARGTELAVGKTNVKVKRKFWWLKGIESSQIPGKAL